MGIVRSIIRFLGFKPEDEEGEWPIHPYQVLPWRQNYHPCIGDSSSSSDTLRKILSLPIFIYNSLKGLLQKVGFILYLSRPRETADPILPLQNPATRISNDLFLEQNLLISSPSADSIAGSSPDRETTTFAPFVEANADEEIYGINVDVEYSEGCPEENYSTNIKQMDHVMISIPDFTYSLAHTSASEEMIDSAVFMSPERETATVAPFVESNSDEEMHGINGDVEYSEQWPEENYSTNVKQMDHEMISIPDFTYLLAHTSASEGRIHSAVFMEEIAPQNAPSCLEEGIALNSSDGKGEEEEVEEIQKECVVIKSTVVVDEGRWIKHYSSRHRILLVGEGDFSFSACLAVAFLCASNMIATSLDSESFLKESYQNALSNIGKLRSRGCKVMHGIDATQMANHALLGNIKFDRIIYNFPFAGFFKELSRESQLRRHRRLVSLFLKNAKEMISEDGEIHISHKTNGFHKEWKLESIASSHRLRLIEAVQFNQRDYPGYNTKYGFGTDNNFNCNPSKTNKFGHKMIRM